MVTQTYFPKDNSTDPGLKKTKQTQSPCPRLYLLDNGRVFCTEVDCTCSLNDSIKACRESNPEEIELIITPKIRLKAVDKLINKLRHIGYKTIALSFAPVV